MQKDEIVTIRTNTEVKRIIDEAKSTTGQTAGDWLYQAVTAWQEKYQYMEEPKEFDSLHILSGRKALAEAAKVLEALEVAGKQAYENSREQNMEWHKKYALLEDELSKQKEGYIKQIEDLENCLKKSDKTISEKDKIISKQAKEIDTLEGHQTSIQEITKHLEQERSQSVKIYNIKVKLEQEILDLEKKSRQVESLNEQNKHEIGELKKENIKITEKYQNIEKDLLDKERQIIKLTLNKDFAENSIGQLQENIKILNEQIKSMQEDNLKLIREKSELLGELTITKKHINQSI